MVKQSVSVGSMVLSLAAFSCTPDKSEAPMVEGMLPPPAVAPERGAGTPSGEIALPPPGWDPHREVFPGPVGSSALEGVRNELAAFRVTPEEAARRLGAAYSEMSPAELAIERRAVSQGVKGELTRFGRTSQTVLLIGVESALEVVTGGEAFSKEEVARIIPAVVLAARSAMGFSAVMTPEEERVAFAALRAGGNPARYGELLQQLGGEEAR